MKNFLILILCVLISYTALAHNETTSLDSAVHIPFEEDQLRLGNRFKPYWFLSGSVGGQIYYGDHNRRMAFGDRLTPFFAVRGGYWFDQDFGARVGINGFSVNGLTQNGSHLASDEWYEQAHRLKRQKINYFHVSGDVMYRILNLFEGNRRNRQYELLPYLGVGVMVATSEPKARNMSISVGINNAFHINKTWDVTFDIRAVATGDGFDGERGGLRGEGTLSTSIGLVYNIK